MTISDDDHQLEMEKFDSVHSSLAKRDPGKSGLSYMVSLPQYNESQGPIVVSDTAVIGSKAVDILRTVALLLSKMVLTRTSDHSLDIRKDLYRRFSLQIWLQI